LLPSSSPLLPPLPVESSLNQAAVRVREEWYEILGKAEEVPENLVRVNEE